MSPETHHEHDAGEPHGSLKDYLIGFGLSVVLTAIPFWLVMAHPFANGVTAALVMGFAAVQILVHMIYFLHMNGKAEGGWPMTALVFTLIVVVITLSGSLWVMYNLNTNMMPMPDPSQLP
ncbi:cytochrome o ubiquinol oxidase subunit IV [Sphingomonas sp.]|uniref:cytochrome o ubiquinol oxidase subunit IV n=1 Tax=Sphingomonas sp. TaxID=28214 RepID=UPI001B04CAA6|nr:cytochrome o ubiquinol oxidase subunit IV [Sphingomonas sp.]MBO9715111.1 cytochrome o ubiquinol oxidase subunit IV [Sphingomonas sp.]